MIATVTDPAAFRETTATSRAFVARTFDDEDRRWLAALPRVEGALAERWSLELDVELGGGTLASVRAARCADGGEAVLKVGAPWSRAVDEAVALRHLAGRGVPAVIASDDEVHALLLERIRPGTHLEPGDADAAADVLRRLHASPPPGLPSLATIARRRIDQAVDQGRASPRKAAWARRAVDRLDESGEDEATLVHGDFDDRNLLVCGQRGLVAIDLLPCVGDPAYDAASWAHADRRPGRRGRFEAIVAATGLPRERVRDWAAVIGIHG